MPSKKGYWMAMVEVTDAKTYERYKKENAPAFDNYGGKVLVHAGRTLMPEGAVGDHEVLIEFETFDQAVACYESPEYQSALKLREAAATAKLVIVEGA